MEASEHLKKSKYLCLVLRHRPVKIGISLDKKGWTDVSILIEKTNASQSLKLSLEDIEEIVRDCPKNRYTLFDGMIKANQGHSVKGVVAFDLKCRVPPVTLWHGSTKQRWDKGIKKKGLLPMNRHHVHLSEDLETAKSVGERHRKEELLILKVDAKKMLADGYKFYRSDNGVWMTDLVPVKYLS